MNSKRWRLSFKYGKSSLVATASFYERPLLRINGVKRAYAFDEYGKWSVRDYYSDDEIDSVSCDLDTILSLLIGVGIKMINERIDYDDYN